MARKKVSRTLSPLPSRRRLDRVDHKTDGLAEILRTVALTNRRDQPRAFHSMREVSAHFKVPFSTVARVYDRLEREGLLTRVRGAKTLLQGSHFDRRQGVRAFVGLPASLSAFITIQPYRTFFIRIRRELRLRGFATGMIFYQKDQARTGALSKRLKAYEVDTVLWFQPPREARETAVRLADLGIRLISIAHESAPLMPCRYHVQRSQAIEELLASWKAEGIDQITVAQWKEQSTPVLEETLNSVVEELEIKSRAAIFNGQTSRKYLRALQQVKTGGLVFCSAQLASRLCFRAPHEVTELLRNQRVAFLNGPVSMPFAKVPDVPVDLVVVDWQWVAEQIVQDLISQDAFQLAGPTVFEARAELRVLLRDFAQEI